MIQNRYLIVQLIGKGGMGEVYLAVDQRLGSAVALKRTFFANDEMLGNAFEREAKILARLRHPVLPKVSDHFAEGDEQYLVMEHIAGDDLSKRLEAAHKPFPVSWVLFWADQLLDALSYLHSHEPPIIHRDIKPQNLKLTDENHIVLLDFGLSKNSSGLTNIPGTSSSASGSVVGYTPHYAPMEQIRGTGTSPRSDLYALSATLYQLMTNSVPMDALSRADSLLNEQPDPIRPLTDINPEIAPDISKVILKGMEVSQEKRWANARDMQKALRKAYSQVQEAMTAHTIAFNAHEMPPGAAEHYSKSSPPTEALNHEPGNELPTRINSTPGLPSQAESQPANGSGFETSIANPAPPIDSLPKQSDIKTEVFLAGSTPFAGVVPDEPLPAEPENKFPSYRSQPEPAPPAQEKFSETNDFGNVPAYTGDATIPNIAYEQGAGATPSVPNPDFFTTPSVSPGVQETSAYSPSEFSPEPQEQYQNQAATAQAFQSVPPKQAAPVKKKSSKAFIIFGVLAVLFVLGLGAAGAGWYVYQNYATAAAEPTPSPEPTFAPTPSPEPTFESVNPSNTTDNTNSSTDSGLDTNVNSSNIKPEPTVEPTPVRTQVETPSNTERARPTPQATRTQTRPSVTPVVKPTPKKTESDRGKILQ
jgi:serine/threonine protein kinase